MTSTLSFGRAQEGLLFLQEIRLEEPFNAQLQIHNVSGSSVENLALSLPVEEIPGFGMRLVVRHSGLPTSIHAGSARHVCMANFAMCMVLRSAVDAGSTWRNGGGAAAVAESHDRMYFLTIA